MKRQYEEWAIQRLSEIVMLDNRDRDALPGSVVKKVKEAIRILKKRRK